MRQRSHFRQWAGTFAAVCVAGLVTAPIGVRSQSPPDAATAQPDVPSQQPSMRRPSAGAGTSGGSATRRRPLDADSYFDPLSLLVQPSAAVVTPHPLAATYPHHDVIVCIAGCSPKPGPSIVYITARAHSSSGAKVVSGGQVHLASSTTQPPAAGPPNVGIACIAGCSSPSTYKRTSVHRQTVAKQVKPITAKRAKMAKRR